MVLRQSVMALWPLDRRDNYAIKSQRLEYESGPVDGVHCRLVNVQIGSTIYQASKGAAFEGTGFRQIGFRFSFSTACDSPM
jgi:hypothetical protein